MSNVSDNIVECNVVKCNVVTLDLINQIEEHIDTLRNYVQYGNSRIFRSYLGEPSEYILESCTLNVLPCKVTKSRFNRVDGGCKCDLATLDGGFTLDYYFEPPSTLSNMHYIIINKEDNYIYRLVKGKYYLDSVERLSNIIHACYFDPNDNTHKWDIKFIYYYMKYCSTHNRLCDKFPVCSIEIQKNIINAVELFNEQVTKIAWTPPSLTIRGEPV